MANEVQYFPIWYISSTLPTPNGLAVADAAGCEFTTDTDSQLFLYYSFPMISTGYLASYSNGSWPVDAGIFVVMEHAQLGGDPDVFPAGNSTQLRGASGLGNRRNANPAFPSQTLIG